MFDNAISKVNQDVTVPGGIFVLVTVIAFLMGVIMGIVLSPVKKGIMSKADKKDFNADEYVRSLNFDE